MPAYMAATLPPMLCAMTRIGRPGEAGPATRPGRRSNPGTSSLRAAIRCRRTHASPGRRSSRARAGDRRGIARSRRHPSSRGAARRAGGALAPPGQPVAQTADRLFRARVCDAAGAIMAFDCAITAAGDHGSICDSRPQRGENDMTLNPPPPDRHAHCPGRPQLGHDRAPLRVSLFVLPIIRCVVGPLMV